MAAPARVSCSAARAAPARAAAQQILHAYTGRITHGHWAIWQPGPVMDRARRAGENLAIRLTGAKPKAVGIRVWLKMPADVM
jgi:hypothetical protein